MKAIVSEKGQVTIPKACRDRLGLRPGTVLDFNARAGTLVAVKSPNTDPFSKWKGRCTLPGRPNVNDYLRGIRE